MISPDRQPQSRLHGRARYGGAPAPVVGRDERQPVTLEQRSRFDSPFTLLITFPSTLASETRPLPPAA